MEYQAYSDCSLRFSVVCRLECVGKTPGAEDIKPAKISSIVPTHLVCIAVKDKSGLSSTTVSPLDLSIFAAIDEIDNVCPSPACIITRRFFESPMRLVARNVTAPQAELGIGVGVSRRTVARIEPGRYDHTAVLDEVVATPE